MGYKETGCIVCHRLHSISTILYITTIYYEARFYIHSPILTATPVVFSPTASTSPEHSNPMVIGVFGGLSITPCLTIRSRKFNPLKTNQYYTTCFMHALLNLRLMEELTALYMVFHD